MTLSFTGRKRIRKNFGRISAATSMPNLIEVQKNSYDAFLQKEVAAEERRDAGLQAVFRSVFPIRDFSDRAQLDFVAYSFDRPKYDVDECQQRGMTYAAPLRLTLRLIVWDVEEETRARTVRDIKERRIPRASTCSRRGSSPIAARGSISSSTPRTSSSSASTAAASCR
jgi:DNA-directed RNA polymerase subunit beta